MDSLVDAMSSDRMEVAERSSYQEALVEVISQKLLGKAAPTKVLEAPRPLAPALRDENDLPKYAAAVEHAVSLGDLRQRKAGRYRHSSRFAAIRATQV